MAKYVPSTKEKAFLQSVTSPKYNRQLINGLHPFFSESAPEDVRSFYSESEIVQLQALRGTDRDVEKRMPVKLTRHYFELAKHSKPLQRL